MTDAERSQMGAIPHGPVGEEDWIGLGASITNQLVALRALESGESVGCRIRVSNHIDGKLIKP